MMQQGNGTRQENTDHPHKINATILFGHDIIFWGRFLG